MLQIQGPASIAIMNAASGGAIGLVQSGDIIDINIPDRSINVRLEKAELLRRRKLMGERESKAWQPINTRERRISPALKAYARMATSADKGAVRDINLFD